MNTVYIRTKITSQWHHCCIKLIQVLGFCGDWFLLKIKKENFLVNADNSRAKYNYKIILNRIGALLAKAVGGGATFLAHLVSSTTFWQSDIGFSPLIATLKPQSNGPLYSNTVIGTLAADGWAVTFSTAMRGLSGLRPHPVPSSLYQM